MKNKILPSIFTICIMLSFMTMFAKAVAYDSYNYSRLIEVYPITYQGYGQCKPSSWVAGRSPARCYIRFKGGRDGDTGRIYSAYGRSKYDPNIYSVMRYHYDSWSLTAPKTEFYYDCDFVSTNSNLWPV